MRSIQLINPEEARLVFINNRWIEKSNYFIKFNHEEEEYTLVDSSISHARQSGTSLKVKFGNAEYTIPLVEYERDITIELKDITDLGSLLLINNTPHLLRIYRTASMLSTNQIGNFYPSLKIIDFGSGKNEHIQNLDGIVSCKELHTLNLDDCPSLKDITGLQEFNDLRALWLDGFKDYKQYRYISECKCLEGLSQNGSELISLDHLIPLVNLKIISFCGNTELIDLNPLSHLKKLTNLYLENCTNISDIGPLSNLNALTYLNLRSVDKIINISPLSDLKSMTNLILEYCWQITDITPLSELKSITELNLGNCAEVSDFSPLSELKKITNLNLESCNNIIDLTPLSELINITELNLGNNSSITDLYPISNLKSLRKLSINACEKILDLSPLSYLTRLTYLDLSWNETISNFSSISNLKELIQLNLIYCTKISDLSPLSGLKGLIYLDMGGCKNLTKVYPISHLSNLKQINLSECSNIRDIEKLSLLPQLNELEWIDPVACSQILMQAAIHRSDTEFIHKNIDKWITEISLSKDCLTFVSKILNCIGLLQKDDRKQRIIDTSNAMRSRGLQSEVLNDLDSDTWERWCDLVLNLEFQEALDCFNEAVDNLNIQRETEVLLGPVIIASSELIEKYPSEKSTMLAWVNEQLQQLQNYPAEECQIAPSAAVFFASLNMKEEVLFWLQKATDEKAPLWREKVLSALISYYARKGEFAECRRLLDQMQIQDEIDRAIAELAQYMAQHYPVDAAFMLDEIQDLAISTETARKLLQQPKVLQEPQGVYQLLLHLQSNPDELATTLEILIEKDTNGKVAEAIKQLFLQKQPTGPSAAVMLELCKHTVVGQFVKAWKLEELMNQLREESANEQKVYAREFIDLLESKKLIDSQENLIMKEKIIN